MGASRLLDVLDPGESLDDGLSGAHRVFDSLDGSTKPGLEEH